MTAKLTILHQFTIDDSEPVSKSHRLEGVRTPLRALR